MPVYILNDDFQQVPVEDYLTTCDAVTQKGLRRAIEQLEATRSITLRGAQGLNDRWEVLLPDDGNQMYRYVLYYVAPDKQADFSRYAHAVYTTPLSERMERGSFRIIDFDAIRDYYIEHQNPHGPGELEPKPVWTKIIRPRLRQVLDDIHEKKQTDEYRLLDDGRVRIHLRNLKGEPDLVLHGRWQ